MSRSALRVNPAMWFSRFAQQLFAIMGILIDGGFVVPVSLKFGVVWQTVFMA